MMEKSKDMRGQIQMTCPESLVPADRPLRKIDKAVDFNRIYGMVEHLYPTMILFWKKVMSNDNARISRTI